MSSNSPYGGSGESSVLKGNEILLSECALRVCGVILSSLRAIRVIDVRSVVRSM